MKISLVVAVSENGVIGKDNKIPWNPIPEDLKHFKKITETHHVLMGRKTFESIFQKLNGPLPDRVNLILSKNPNFNPEGVFVFSDFNEAVNFAKKQNEEELMVIGGAEIYKMALPLTERIYMTRVITNVEGDTYMPYIDLKKWRVIEQRMCSKPELAYEFRTLERK